MEREGLPRSFNKYNKIRGLLLDRTRRVYQSCAPTSSQYRSTHRAKMRFGFAGLSATQRISLEGSFPDCEVA